MCPRNNSNAAFDESGALTLIKCVLLFKTMLCGRLAGWLAGVVEVLVVLMVVEGGGGGGGSAVQLKNHFQDLKLPAECCVVRSEKCFYVGIKPK